MTRPFEKFEARVRAVFPKIEMQVDSPRNPNGSTFLHLQLGDQTGALEYRPKHGYGLTFPANDDFGVGPDEVFKSESAAVTRVLALLRSEQPTLPVHELSLKMLRELRKVTQQELAERLGVRQASVSKLEQRDEDVLVSSLRKIVQAMGGELGLVAEFPEGTLRVALNASRVEDRPAKSRYRAKPARAPKRR